MIATWEARRLESILDGGRTRPLLIDCERRAGRQALRERFVVKALGLPEVQEYSLCNEVFGAAIASWCGVPAGAAALVDVSQGFINANAGAFARSRVTVLPGLASGSTFHPSLKPMSRFPVIGDDDMKDAAAIYALDMAIQNPDRRPEKPNCGYISGSLFAFDFESAFSFRFGLFNPPPWAVTRFQFRANHLFFRALQKRQWTVWTPFMDRVRALEAQSFEHLCGTMPEAWRPHADAILKHLQTLGEHADDFEGELGRSLL